MVERVLASGPDMRRATAPVRTAWRLLAAGQLKNVVRAAGARLVRGGRAVRRWWVRDRAWVGWMVAARGNVVGIDGCRFDVSHPAISHAMRSRLWRGRYERSERALLAAHLDPVHPVIELGGGLGVVATIVNRRLVEPTRHVVVEPNPSLIAVLERQKAMNGARYIVEHGAIDYSTAAFAALDDEHEFLARRVGTSGRSLPVPRLTFRTLVERYAWRDATLICDIEGLEVDLVRREGDLVARHCRNVIVEIHPEFRSRAECVSVVEGLERRGFELIARLRKVHAFRQRETATPARRVRS